MVSDGYAIRMFRPDGRKYDGQWVNGKQEGQGTYTNEKGVTRVGDWKEGKCVG